MSGEPGNTTDQKGRVPVRLVRITSRPGLQRQTALVTGLIVLAIVKPWAWGQPPPAPAPHLPRAPIRVSPVDTPAVVAPDPVAAICHDSPSWRVASVGDFLGGTLREWAFVTPVPAAGPADPSIPYALFAFDRVEALGYCAPTDKAPGSGVIIGVYQLGADGARVPIVVRRLEHTPASSVAGLFERGPAGPSGSPGPGDSPNAGWLPGRYVFSLRSPSGLAVWFGVEVLASLTRGA